MKKQYIYAKSLVALAVMTAYSPAWAEDVPKAGETVELETVNVVGSAGKIDGVKFKSAQSNAVIRRDKLDETAAVKVEDALKYESGVRTGMYGYDTKQEWIKVRGFDASVSIDGSPVTQNGFFTTVPNTYGLERVELIKGADSLTYGSSETGGLVNMVTKRPARERQGEIGVNVGTQGQRGIFADYSAPVPAANNVYYRIVGNVFRKEGDTNGKTNNYYIAPSVTWDLGEKTSLTALASFSRQHGVPTSVHLPAKGALFPTAAGRIPAGTHYGEPDADYLKRNQYSAGYEFKHGFGKGWNFTQNYRHNQIDLDWLGTFAWDSDGNRTVSRGYSHTDGRMKTHTIDNRLSKEWKGGNWKNTLLGGVDYLHSDTKGVNNGFGAVNPIDMFAPVYGNGGIVKNATPYTQKQKQLGFYLRNQLTWGGLVANAGIRHDKAKADSLSNGTVSKYDINHTSYQGSLMYNFKNGISPYASYSESFKPITGADAAGNGYKPYEGRQYEAGVKYRPTFMDARFSAAYFDLEEKNALVADASAVQRQIGKRRGKGAEFQADAYFTDNLSAALSYTYTDSKQDLRYNQTVRSALIPKHQASAQVKYAFNSGALNGLTLGTGVRYVGSTADEQYWPGYKIPSYTLVDMMAHYKFGKRWNAQVNVNNLTNKKHLGGCDYYCYYGAERSVLGSVSYKF